MPSEDYVRPPIVARELPDQRVWTWALRAVMLLLLIAVGVGAFYLARAVIDSGEGSAQAGPPAAVAVTS